MATIRLSTQFNAVVQFDLVFISDLIIGHLLDEALRWSCAGLLAAKSAVSIVKLITNNWLRIFRPMLVIVTDQESGMTSDEVSTWSEAWGIQIKLKPRGTRAQV
eukprot:12922176-Heterocapsa_arctica.AAC.1